MVRRFAVDSRSFLQFTITLTAVLAIQASLLAGDASKGGESVTKVSGKELFAREWLPNDPRSHGGDGLGPVFNDSSCIACHNQGGAGGGGPVSRNVDIVSAFLTNASVLNIPRDSLVGSLLNSFGLTTGNRSSAEQRKKGLERRRNSLVREAEGLHPGFLTAGSIVIHKSGTDAEYSNWRQRMLGGQTGFFPFAQQRMIQAPAVVSVTEIETVEEVELNVVVSDQPAETVELVEFDAAQLSQSDQTIQSVRSTMSPASFQTFPRRNGSFTLTTTQRNPTALFGTGIIDAIPDSVIEAAAKRNFKEFPGVSGRVCRLPDNKIGRFGWKAQKSSLRDFAMTACAVELGLHVPTHSQSGQPLKPGYKPTGYDMDKAECDALVEYLQALPAPDQVLPQSEEAVDYIESGHQLFAAVGCTACHTEQLAETEGIYSDLLLHDMGEDLGDTGDYGVFIPDSPGGDAAGIVPPLVDAAQQKSQAKDAVLGATRVEWRTPPLWGVRDSGPYMHDGRAATVEQAVAFHGGESTVSARRFFALKPEQRQQVVAFLKSLSAPTQVAAR